ncbi:MAG: nucleotide pyrophosphohydrolase [Planctomycetota bacterium]|nr:MAG: nucleotide pyrophosphohydrolase [Planctomycetota bacterium]
MSDMPKQPETGSDISPPKPNATTKTDITFAEFQALIRTMYLEKDIARGIDGTFMWLMEEVGELAAALRNGTREEQAAEFADVIAWLTTIANVAGVDLTAALAEKYGAGCPGCGRYVCECPDSGKP